MIDRYNAFVHCEPKVASTKNVAGGALSGMTIGVKANIAVAGMPFHAGLGAWENRIAESDAEVVRRLRNAGAIIAGILNMEEGALGAKTDNPHFGPTHNPHRHGYSPGGSSGGSGAAVAAGLCDAALGTDTMGSIRIPAAHCGIYGFKPANDSVSQDGLIQADSALDAIGPLTRDLDTLEKISREICDFGEGKKDGSGAVLKNHGVELNPKVAEAFKSACATLESQPAIAHLSHSNSRIRFAGFIGVSRAMARQLAGVVVSERLSKLLQYGPARNEPDWEEDRSILNKTGSEIREIVEQHGFLILPTVPNPPFPHLEPEPAAQADFTCLANIAGLPAISLPAGWTEDRLPIGVQLIGLPGTEAGLFELARQLDRKLGAYAAPAEGA